MADYNEDFMSAFDNAMRYEVGPFWDSTDPDVIAGSIDTRDHRRKVGLTNIPGDDGGPTKYGIAQNQHPGLAVKDLTLDDAMTIYHDSYWIKSHCEELPHPATIFYFDCCVNLGMGRGAKFLQQAVNVTVDGDIGPATINASGQLDQAQLIQNLSKIRSNFYNAIVQRNPSQGMFLDGWLRRVSEVTTLTLSKLQ